MRLITVKDELMTIPEFLKETEFKDSNGHERPFLLVLRLKYKNESKSFAIPFRSNIQVNQNTKGTYFPLPRRKTTKDYHVHGLHLVKMFPIESKYYDKFNVPETKYDQNLKKYIDSKVDKIVKAAQV